MAWKRYGRPTNYDDERLQQGLLNGERALAKGITAERFAVKKQQELREMGGTQTDAERLADITDDGGAGEPRPVSAWMLAQTDKLFAQVMARQQEMVGVAA